MLLASIAAETLDPLITLTLKSDIKINENLEKDILDLIQSFKETLEGVKLVYSEGSPQIREAMTSFLSQFLGASKVLQNSLKYLGESGLDSRNPASRSSLLIRDHLHEMFKGFLAFLKDIVEQADSISDFIALKELSADNADEPAHPDDLDGKEELTKKKAWMESTMLLLRALVFQGEGALFLSEVVDLLPSLFKLQVLKCLFCDVVNRALSP